MQVKQDPTASICCSNAQTCFGIIHVYCHHTVSSTHMLTMSALPGSSAVMSSTHLKRSTWACSCRCWWNSCCCSYKIHSQQLEHCTSRPMPHSPHDAHVSGTSYCNVVSKLQT